MVTLYIPGTATVIDGYSVDYADVDESQVEAFIAAGWVTSPSDSGKTEEESGS